MATVHIVIVNYRTPALVADCLRSLAPQMAAGWRATVVDGGSGDGSAERLAAAIADNGSGGWCDLLPLADNRGFAAGNNAAIRQALARPDPPDYFHLLNPDTVARPGAVAALADFLDAHPSVGIAGSRLEHPDGTPQRSAFRFPGLASEFEAGVRLGPVSKLLWRKLVAPPVQDVAHPTDWVSGASLMVRRAVVEAVGLMDDGFFLYYEETDFCRRAAAAGWPAWYVPASRVVHLVGQSTGVGRPTARRVPVYLLESRRRYLDRWHGHWYRRGCDAAWAAGYASWRVRRRLQGKPDPDPPGLLADFVRFAVRPEQAVAPAR